MTALGGLILTAGPVVAPATAQNTVAPGMENTKTQAADEPAPDTQEKRLRLAERMHEIWSMRERINAALKSMAQRYPEEERDSFMNAMQLAMDYSRIEEASIDAMVNTFTTAELQAMVDYYGSKSGQSAEDKRSIYQDRIQPVIQKMIDKAMMAYKTGETSNQ